MFWKTFYGWNSQSSQLADQYSYFNIYTRYFDIVLTPVFCIGNIDNGGYINTKLSVELLPNIGFGLKANAVIYLESVSVLPLNLVNHIFYVADISIRNSLCRTPPHVSAQCIIDK